MGRAAFDGLKAPAASRAVDVRIARDVLGHDVYPGSDAGWHWLETVTVEGIKQERVVQVPQYSRDIKAAWQIVEHLLRVDDDTTHLRFLQQMDQLGGWCVPEQVICPRICYAALGIPSL